ncbi:hypothetical protein ACFL2I_07895, partial [Candidatus Omnitrophota bacterium]
MNTMGARLVIKQAEEDNKPVPSILFNTPGSDNIESYEKDPTIRILRRNDNININFYKTEQEADQISESGYAPGIHIMPYAVAYSTKLRKVSLGNLRLYLPDDVHKGVFDGGMQQSAILDIGMLLNEAAQAEHEGNKPLAEKYRTTAVQTLYWSAIFIDVVGRLWQAQKTPRGNSDILRPVEDQKGGTLVPYYECEETKAAEIVSDVMARFGLATWNQRAKDKINEIIQSAAFEMRAKELQKDYFFNTEIEIPDIILAERGRGRPRHVPAWPEEGAILYVTGALESNYRVDNNAFTGQDLLTIAKHLLRPDTEKTDLFQMIKEAPLTVACSGTASVLAAPLKKVGIKKVIQVSSNAETTLDPGRYSALYECDQKQQAVETTNEHIAKGVTQIVITGENNREIRETAEELAAEPDGRLRKELSDEFQKTTRLLEKGDMSVEQATEHLNNLLREPGKKVMICFIHGMHTDVLAQSLEVLTNLIQANLNNLDATIVLACPDFTSGQNQYTRPQIEHLLDLQRRGLQPGLLINLGLAATTNTNQRQNRFLGALLRGETSLGSRLNGSMVQIMNYAQSDELTPRTKAQLAELIRDGKRKQADALIRRIEQEKEEKHKEQALALAEGKQRKRGGILTSAANRALTSAEINKQVNKVMKRYGIEPDEKSIISPITQISQAIESSTVAAIEFAELNAQQAPQNDAPALEQVASAYDAAESILSNPCLPLIRPQTATSGDGGKPTDTKTTTAADDDDNNGFADIPRAAELEELDDNSPLKRFLAPLLALVQDENDELDNRRRKEIINFINQLLAKARKLVAIDENDHLTGDFTEEGDIIRNPLNYFIGFAYDRDGNLVPTAQFTVLGAKVDKKFIGSLGHMGAQEKQKAIEGQTHATDPVTTPDPAMTTEEAWQTAMDLVGQDLDEAKDVVVALEKSGVDVGEEGSEERETLEAEIWRERHSDRLIALQAKALRDSGQKETADVLDHYADQQLKIRERKEKRERRLRAAAQNSKWLKGAFKWQNSDDKVKQIIGFFGNLHPAMLRFAAGAIWAGKTERHRQRNNTWGSRGTLFELALTRPELQVSLARRPREMSEDQRLKLIQFMIGLAGLIYPGLSEEAIEEIQQIAQDLGRDLWGLPVNILVAAGLGTPEGVDSYLKYLAASRFARSIYIDRHPLDARWGLSRVTVVASRKALKQRQAGVTAAEIDKKLLPEKDAQEESTQADEPEQKDQSLAAQTALHLAKLEHSMLTRMFRRAFFFIFPAEDWVRDEHRHRAGPIVHSLTMPGFSSNGDGLGLKQLRALFKAQGNDVDLSRVSGRQIARSEIVIPQRNRKDNSRILKTDIIDPAVDVVDEQERKGVISAALKKHPLQPNDVNRNKGSPGNHGLPTKDELEDLKKKHPEFADRLDKLIQIVGALEGKVAVDRDGWLNNPAELLGQVDRALDAEGLGHLKGFAHEQIKAHEEQLDHEAGIKAQLDLLAADNAPATVDEAKPVQPVTPSTNNQTTTKEPLNPAARIPEIRGKTKKFGPEKTSWNQQKTREDLSLVVARAILLAGRETLFIAPAVAAFLALSLPLA